MDIGIMVSNMWIFIIHSFLLVNFI